MVREAEMIFTAVILMTCHVSFGAPPRVPFGPQEGMDFLHGVMMHGDEKPGDSHKNQDEYQRLQDIDKVRADAKDNKDGPQEAMDYLHGVLMHGDEKAGEVHMEQKRGPSIEGGTNQAAGPCKGMDCMHGVMMHGDEEQGRDHSRQDAKKAEVKTQPSGQFDPEHLLHEGKEGAHDENSPENFDNKENKDKHNGTKSSVGDPEHLLHQGSDDVHDDSKSKEVDTKPKIGQMSAAMDPHHFLHGAEGTDSHDEEKQKIVEEALSGSKAVNPKDPDEMIHELEKEAAKIGTMSKEEAKDYKQWKEEKSNEKNEGGFLGFSFPYISDSIMDEIDILKRRYLSKFWGEDNSEFSSRPSSRTKATEKPKYDVKGDMRHELEGIGSTDPLRDHSHENKENTQKKKALRKDL